MQIPTSVYTKYAEAMAMFSSLDNFGVQCTLIYQKVVPLSVDPSVLKQKLTMQQKMGQAGVLRGGESTKTIEVSESIVLRVYEDKKSFIRIGNFEYSAGSCLTIGTLAQMEDLRKANYLIINSDRSSQDRLQRSGEVLKWGLNTDYCVAHWVK